MVIAKFTVSRIERHDYGNNYSSNKVILSATYDNSIEEDKRFAKATPSGSCEMVIDNPPALEFFQPGKPYYLKFEKAFNESA